MRLLYIAWGFAIAGLVLLSMNAGKEQTSFQGFTENMEISVNSENSLEIRKIHVVPGQEVAKGDLLVEFNRQELDQRLNETSHQLEDLKSQKELVRSETERAVQELRSQNTLKQNELGSRIERLRSQLHLNKQLMNDLKSIARNEKSGKRSSPTQVLISQLKKERNLSEEQTRTKIRMLEQELEKREESINIRIEKLEAELTLLHREKNRLYIFAQFSGIIGSVNFKEGEKASPFQTILSLYRKTPSYVKGYINENVYNRVAIGNRVEVISAVTGFKRVAGEVVGVGSRIIRLPVRFARPEFPIWGREVQIRIPEGNRFLLGEKVVVVSHNSLQNSYLAKYLKMLFPVEDTHAGELKDQPGLLPEEEPVPVAGPVTDIRKNETISAIRPVEASGILYLDDLKKYLVISDDTKSKKPDLYLVNDQARIEDILTVSGLDKINDMESVSAGKDNTIYIACSQSYNKKGNLPDSRKLLIRVRREGLMLTLDKKIDLHELLKEAATADRENAWSRAVLTARGDMDVDIEGIFVRDGALYLGLKSPLRNNAAMILKIADFERIFDGFRPGAGDVILWKELLLKDNGSGSPTRISDLFFHNGLIYILSCTLPSDGQNGNLWAFDPVRDSLRHLYRFKGMKPEGITFDPNDSAFVIVSDHGDKEPSKMMRLGGVS